MENRRGSTDGVDDVANHSPRDGIQEHNFAEQFSSDLQSVTMSSSAPSGSSSPFAALRDKVPSAAKVDDRDVAQHGGSAVSNLKKLEHSLPRGPMQLPVGFGMVDSIGRPPVVYASNYDVAPGAFPVRSARNATAASRTFRSPISSHDPPREFLNEESKQEEGVSNSAAAGIDLYAVEAQRVPDGNDDGTVMVAEAEHLRTKWYQRRWIFVGLTCCLVGTVVIIVVLVVRQPSPATTGSSSSSTSATTPPITAAPATPDPTTVPPTTPPITAAPATPDPTTVPPTTPPITAAPATPYPTTAPPTTPPTTAAPATPDPTTAPPTTPPITAAPATPYPTTAPPTTPPITAAPITLDPTAMPPTPQPISTAPPTRAPTARAPSSSKPTSVLTPEGIACNFLSIPNVTRCRSTFVFDSYNGDTPTGSTIPSEIGLLTQMTYLDLGFNSLTSSIPSEIGLLTQLTYLDFWNNALTSSIPSEIGLLTKLTDLFLNNNTLSGTIPSSLCSLSSLYGWIVIDCVDITCASGCCLDSSCFSCG